MTEPTLITISEFARRTMTSKCKAYEIARSRAICEAGVAVRLDPSVGSGGAIRFNWPAYLEFIKEYPALPDYKRWQERSAAVKQAKKISKRSKKPNASSE